MDLTSIPQSVVDLSKRITHRGGRALLVGGAVIDLIQRSVPKDWDFEVFGLDYTDLERHMSDLSPKTVGRSFGTMKITLHDGVQVDLNIPRTDSKSGAGHAGFTVKTDPRMTFTEAARRRDITINAMSLDILTGEMIDPFGGRSDLIEGLIKATDFATFTDDPLRPLRVMQLLARKGKRVDDKTMSLIRSMSSRFTELPKERVFGEFSKLFLRATRPSVGLEFLRESGWIVHFPEIEAMIGCQQRHEWHPEGDVWTHSLLAADASAQIRHTVPDRQREAFCFGVFLHDVGKPISTVTEKMITERDPRVLALAVENRKKPEELFLTAYGHDVAGMEPAESFMRRMTDAWKVIDLVKGIVHHHMQPGNLNAGNASRGAYARLHRKMVEIGGDLRLIGRMCQCDACATSHDWKTRTLSGGSPSWDHESSAKVMEHADAFDSDISSVVQKVSGKDLIALGYKPGREFGRILKDALDIQFSDDCLSREEIISKMGLERKVS